MCTAKALARLRKSAGLQEPSLLALAIGTKISQTGSFHKIIQLLNPCPDVPGYTVCALGAQKNCLNKTVLLSTHNMCSG